jgi:hypothetical protein
MNDHGSGHNLSTKAYNILCLLSFSLLTKCAIHPSQVAPVRCIREGRQHLQLKKSKVFKLVGTLLLQCLEEDTLFMLLNAWTTISTVDV